MAPIDRFQILETCPAADEAEWQRHAAGFAAAFVVPAKRERWLELLTRRPRRIHQHSHKLHSDLDHRTCHCVGEAVPTALTGTGVFYDFSNAPRIFPAGLVASAAGSGDAIFSLIPGQLALYFFHEGEVWECRAG